MPASRFLAVFTATGILTFVLMCVFVVTVDPYALYATPRISGFNDAKSMAFERATKSAAVRRLRPEHVILGSSRAAVGLPPCALANTSAYNYGINGATLAETEQALEVAIENGAKSIVLGLDDFAFASINAGLAQRLSAFRSQHGWSRIETHARLTLSVSALVDAVGTVFSSARGRQASHSEDGLYTGYDPNDVPFRAPDEMTDKPLQSEFDRFESMLVRTQARNIDLRVFISPQFQAHARDDATYAMWVRTVTETGRRVGITVHDLSAIPAFTSTRVEFLDPGHYRPVLGKRIIAYLYGQARTATTCD